MLIPFLSQLCFLLLPALSAPKLVLTSVSGDNPAVNTPLLKSNVTTVKQTCANVKEGRGRIENEICELDIRRGGWNEDGIYIKEYTYALHFDSFVIVLAYTHVHIRPCFFPINLKHFASHSHT